MHLLLDGNRIYHVWYIVKINKMILSGQYDDNNIHSIRMYMIHRDMMYITYMGRESAAKTLRV